MEPLPVAPLPVADVLPRIVNASRGAPVIVTAPPGSGKTTLVPSALLDDLPRNERVILVQPRRLAARAVARWIAHLRRGEIGDEVGYQVRFDRRTSRATRLVAVTPGILLRQFQDDPCLDGIGAVVLDEFHERSIELDLTLGMLLRIRQTVRPDLRLVVMSATLQVDSLLSRIEDAQVISAEGRRFPVEIRHARLRDQRALDEQIVATVREAHLATAGHLLVFLPGVGEILRCRDALVGWADRERVDLFPLYGDLPAEQQDAVLASTSRRKVILATNVAETSLTIDGVTGVIDSGLARQLRVSPDLGLPKLELLPISQASAEQRAGRAGRTAPGICWRLWETAAHAARPAVDPPEILRGDLAEALLQLCLWGERDFLAFPWITPPALDALQFAEQLLVWLGAIDDHRQVTSLGKHLARLPTHPRLGRLIIAGSQEGVLREASLAAAMLSERDPFRAAQHAQRGPRDRVSQRSRSDIYDRVLALQQFHAGSGTSDVGLQCHPGAARQVIRSAEQFFQLADQFRGDFGKGTRADDPEVALCHALLTAFPDRLARCRAGSRDRAAMVGGRGVKLDPQSRVQHEELFLAIELQDAAGDARVRLASAVDRHWLDGPAIQTRDETFFNPTRGQVEARRRTYWIDLLLDESPIEISDPRDAAELLARQALQSMDRILPPNDHPAQQFRLRVMWLATVLPDLDMPPLDDASIKPLLIELSHGRRSLDELRNAPWLDHLHAYVGYERLPEIDRLAPPKMEVPSGHRITLQYRLDGPPILAVRIQELFGWDETPRVAGGRVPVLLHLLGPNYRPQQVTNDLASFWRNTYPTVRKELRRRYPKHAWPENPNVRGN